MSDEFLLKWNDHHNSFFTVLQELCLTDCLTDVTLACGGKIFETHKLLLCACSPYFRSLLVRRLDGLRPIVFLNDVSPLHLELLLQYVYKGEINVLQEELAPLIETARSLQIKGLADGPSDKDSYSSGRQMPTLSSIMDGRSNMSNSKIGDVSKNRSSKKSNRSLLISNQNSPMNDKGNVGATTNLNSTSFFNNTETESEAKPDLDLVTSFSPLDSQPCLEVKDEPMTEEHEEMPITVKGETTSFGYYAEQDLQNEDDQYIMSGTPVTASVNDFHQTSTQVGATYESFNVPQTSFSSSFSSPRRYECIFCCKRFPTPSKLARHALTHTGEKPYSCSYCQKRFTQLIHLKNHVRFAHLSENNLSPVVSSPQPVVKQQ